MRGLGIVAALVIGAFVGLFTAALLGYATGWYWPMPALIVGGAIGGAVLVGRLLPATGGTRGG